MSGDMQHAWARQTITRLLEGSSLGVRAVVVANAAELHERIGGAIAETLWGLAVVMPVDEAAPYTGPLNQQPIPADAADLLAQLVPIVVANASDTGLNLGLLAILSDLWPHVATEERPLIRVRFLNGLMERASTLGNRGEVPRESVVTTAELRVWNRYMPTATGDSGTAADLQRIFTAATAQEAYHLLADHLIGGMDPGTLARILGTLAMQTADQRRDPDGMLLLPLVGALAAERLSATCPPELYTVLLFQLAHQLWWCASRAGLLRRTGSEDQIVDFTLEITKGNAVGVRRYARGLRLDEAGWWAALTPAACAVAARGPAHTQRAVLATWTLAMRSGNRVVAPDDAAAIAAILADDVR